ncbi:Transposable element Tc3 transposase [Caligus rogercresseyi]|uniref:Transposable element Tc3 transposase n=1 Tax=Caligus rogercresseyi TaxID=217165 RepID=A0A7T8HEZ2_CALRO|nr:Transposable element Tc3 transposase [Caligus rogercresseyi]
MTLSKVQCSSSRTHRKRTVPKLFKTGSGPMAPSSEMCRSGPTVFPTSTPWTTTFRGS